MYSSSNTFHWVEAVELHQFVLVIVLIILGYDVPLYFYFMNLTNGEFNFINLPYN